MAGARIESDEDMLDKRAFNQLINEIMRQGYDLETAGKFAALIGDMPELDERGNLVVRDESGKLLKTLNPLKFFGG